MVSKEKRQSVSIAERELERGQDGMWRPTKLTQIKDSQRYLNTLNDVGQSFQPHSDAAKDFAVLKRWVREAESLYENVEIFWPKFAKNKLTPEEQTDGFKRLQPSVGRLKLLTKRVSKIPTFQTKRAVEVVDSVGTIILSHTPKPRLEPGAERFGNDPAQRLRVVIAIEHLKALMADTHWHLLVGVCGLDTCQKFYVKGRKNERFCSRRHMNTSHVRRGRAAKRKLKK